MSMASSSLAEDLQRQSQRGGRLQRKRARTELDSVINADSRSSQSSRKFDSVLAEDLVSRWSWGYVSAIEIQRIADLALQDINETLARAGLGPGYQPTSLSFLAGLGDHRQAPWELQQRA